MRNRTENTKNGQSYCLTPPTLEFSRGASKGEPSLRCFEASSFKGNRKLAVLATGGMCQDRRKVQALRASAGLLGESQKVYRFVSPSSGIFSVKICYHSDTLRLEKGVAARIKRCRAGEGQNGREKKSSPSGCMLPRYKSCSIGFARVVL